MSFISRRIVTTVILWRTVQQDILTTYVWNIKSFFLGILYDTNWILIIRPSHIQYLLAREAFKVEMINDKYHTFYEGWVGFEAIITLLILCL